MSVVKCNVTPVIGSDHPGSSDNDCGYENGHVIKIGDTYHMLMTELFDYGPHPETLGSVPARIGYWTSPDGDNWKRICTIVQGTATGAPDDYEDPKNNTWSSSWYWNEDENRWNIFWRGGHVYRYRSETEGPDGMTGPYTEAAQVYPPLEGDLQNWDTGYIDSFGNIYVGEDGKLYTFFGVGEPEKDDPQWVNGLAWADNIDGPWTRVNTDGNPTFVYSENPFVNIYEINGRKVYFCVYDDLSNQHSLGYGYSFDGVNWVGKTLDLMGYAEWAGNNNFLYSVRTPCCLIREDDGTYTVIFTAFGPSDDAPTNAFASIGRVNVRIDEVQGLSDKYVVFPGHMQDWLPGNEKATLQYGREYSLDGRSTPCGSTYIADTYADVTVEAALRYVDQVWDYDTEKAGVYARRSASPDDNSGYRAYLTSKETVQLYAGNTLLEEVHVGKRPAIFRKLRLSVKGNNIKVYYDSAAEPCIDVTDDTYTDEGYVGIDAVSHWHYERIEIIPD